MKKYKITSIMISCVMALTVFGMPSGAFAAAETQEAANIDLSGEWPDGMTDDADGDALCYGPYLNDLDDPAEDGYVLDEIGYGTLSIMAADPGLGDATEDTPEQGGDVSVPATDEAAAETVADPGVIEQQPQVAVVVKQSAPKAAAKKANPAKVDLPAVKFKSLKVKKTTMTVKWSKLSKKTRKKVKKIQIQYSTDKAFKKNVKTAAGGVKSTSRTIKSLSKGKRYYVRVRAYRKSGSIVHVSKWSGVKTVKTAKSKDSKKLSATSLTLAKGGTKKITLSKGSGKWSIKKNGVLKIKKKTKKYVIVTPCKAGTGVVYCKVGKKKLQCKVKVLNNSVGAPKSQLGYALVVGKPGYLDRVLPKDSALQNLKYDTKKAKVTVTMKTDSKSGQRYAHVKINPLKPGRFTLRASYKDGKNMSQVKWTFAFIKGFRGKASAKKTDANYKKWRKSVISTMVSADMSTWEIIDAIGTLISTGNYGSKGGATGKQLWYGSNGNCVSGSKMMKDFMNDLGVKSKIHSAGNGHPKDIYGNKLTYSKGHKNIWVTLGGKTYELNPQPEAPWPYGVVPR